MDEIFKLQWQLNAYTLKKIGIDYQQSINDPQQKVVWLENFRKALSAELAELTREVRQSGIGTDNGKIEIVDILHFLVSLSHIVAVEPFELPQASIHNTTFDRCVIAAFLALDELQNSIKWKWWAKGGGYQPHRAKQAVLDLWQRFAELCFLFAMDMETVRRIYTAKNEVNFKRQDQNYSEDTKTEQDNEALKPVVRGR
ncbi:MAG: dUTP diphosphatase [Desulforhabdus sp.]|nr:dUTP diphosphatase [Desulforhabdus sp.]